MTREEAIAYFEERRNYNPHNGNPAAERLAIEALRAQQQGNDQTFEKAVRRLGVFGMMFMDRPIGRGLRGRVGRAGCPVEEEVFLMPIVIDDDGNRWIPVNADALRDLVDRYRKLKKQISSLNAQEQRPQKMVTRECVTNTVGKYKRRHNNGC